MPTAPSLFRRLGKCSFFLLRGYSPSKASLLARHDAPISYDYRAVPVAIISDACNAVGTWADIAVKNGQIIATSLNLPFEENALVSKGYATLQVLHLRGFALERHADGLVLTNSMFRLRVTTVEELSMLQEIFVEGCYDLHLGECWNVLDIGANVGFASLAFAAQPWVNQVIAFEPFGPTAAEHAVNVAINTALAAKITLHRYGLADRDETLDVPYYQNLRGSMSIDGLGSWRAVPDATSTRVSIQVRRATSVLDELAPRLRDHPLMVKLDCEGSEYPILSDLENSGWLDRINLIVMETHLHPPEELIRQLRRAKFFLYVRSIVPDRTQCIVLAWRHSATRPNR